LKAIILNSGRGTRLYPLTRKVPKALIEIDSKPLLGHQLDRLIDFGIKSFIVTTGPFDKKIQNYVGREYPTADIQFIKNPKYGTTNYIYSMWLTKNFVDDNVLLLHGDLFFEGRLLKRLADKDDANYVFVNKTLKPPEKDFKALVKDGKVVKIGVDLSEKDAVFSAPLYKFTKSGYLFWIKEIEASVQKGETKIYAENVFNRISGNLSLYPIYFNDEICLEIDTKEDLENAQSRARVRS
jgi:choline kinase